jgi:hypothetical protein
MSSDQDVIAEVNEIARGLFNDPSIPQGFRFDMSRIGDLRRKWEEARAIYKERTGIDVLDAIARHEAWLRSPENAPQLYVERR